MDDNQETASETLGNTVTLRGRWNIQADVAVPEVSSPNANAFHATMKSDPTRPLVALCCDPALPPRIDALEALRAFNLPGMLKPIDWGQVDWPHLGRRFTFLLERPSGSRVMGSINATQQPLGEDEITGGLLKPLLPVLKDLQVRGVAHRAIRPDNLFYMDAGRRTMVLGEGWSTPPGHDQAALFETVECALADPAGRGGSVTSNDLYALGVTLLFLLLGRNPVGNVSEWELLQNKMEYGSYAALVGQYRIPLSMMEPLRGFLSDDPKERWTVVDLDMWMQGRRLSPKQPKLPNRSPRPFPFLGGEYYTARALGVAFAHDFTAAAPIIRSKNLDNWLRRSLGDEQRAEQLQAAIASAQGGGGAGRNTDERLVARACIVLDNSAPIRYRGIGVALDGIGAALAASINDPERRQLIAEIIAARLPVHWVAAQAKPSPEDLRMVQLMEKLPAIIDQQAIGFGVERCLYELNPSHRCLSPLLERDFVSQLSQLLPALERLAERGERREMPIDRHIVAFCFARARRIGDDVLRALASNDQTTRNLGGLRLLAVVQEQTQGASAPAVSKWLAAILEPEVQKYHQRKRRQRIKDKVQKVAEDGRLMALLDAIDNEHERKADEAGFTSAYGEFSSITEQIRQSDTDRAAREEDSRITGEQVAASIAGLVVSVTTAVTTLLWIV